MKVLRVVPNRSRGRLQQAQFNTASDTTWTCTNCIPWALLRCWQLCGPLLRSTSKQCDTSHSAWRCYHRLSGSYLQLGHHVSGTRTCQPVRNCSERPRRASFRSKVSARMTRYSSCRSPAAAFRGRYNKYSSGHKPTLRE